MPSRPLPSSAAAGLTAFGPKITASLLLRSAFYREAAVDPEAWRAAAAMVVLSAVASDTVRYSDLGHFLTLALGNWVFFAIMCIALARWLFVTAVAALPVRLLAGRVDFLALLRCLGLAHAPALFFATPALLYAFGFGSSVTPVTFIAIAALVSLWTVAAFCVAIGAAAVLPTTRALPVALAAHFALLLFNLAFDAVLYRLFLAAYGPTIGAIRPSLLVLHA